MHLEEVVGVGGFLSARRFEPVDEESPFVAIFEFDDDVSAVKERVANARTSGKLSPSQAEVVRVAYDRELATYVPEAEVSA
ncbi:MAG: hypothetical protein JWP02_1309 [Acidimicrobiales bacterium]|nr:hypothetical protein [Acidimicrobiales bacterium]